MSTTVKICCSLLVFAWEVLQRGETLCATERTFVVLAARTLLFLGSDKTFLADKKKRMQEPSSVASSLSLIATGDQVFLVRGGDDHAGGDGGDGNNDGCPCLARAGGGRGGDAHH